MNADPDKAEFQEAEYFTLRSYALGFLASVVLTALPFWLVMSGRTDNFAVAATFLIVCAIAQIMVHSAAFLHVNAKAQGGWTLLAYVFTGVIVVITIGGSLWIMYHLNTNMMPGMMSAGQAGG